MTQTWRDLSAFRAPIISEELFLCRLISPGDTSRRVHLLLFFRHFAKFADCKSQTLAKLAFETKARNESANDAFIEITFYKFPATYRNGRQFLSDNALG